MKKILISLLFVSVVLTGVCEKAFGGKMEVFTLKNNIKVIFCKTEGVEVASVKIFTPVSVLYENSNNYGMSSLVSKIMVKATENRTNEILAEDIDNIGAGLGADADYDFACLDMNMLSEYFESGIEILADIIKNPLFNEKDISVEKQLAIAGLASRKDSIARTTMDIFTKELYKNMQYANPVTGTQETISKITAEELKKWHKMSYNASTIIISIAGNLDKNKVKKIVEKYFGDMERANLPERNIADVVLNEDKVVKVKGKFNQAYIFKGFLAPDLLDKDFVTLKVINALLGGRMTSTLFIELREKLGLAYEVGAMYPSRIEQSFFTIYLGLDKKNIDLTVKRIDEILKEFCEREVDAQELIDTKTYIKGLYIMDRQTVGKQSYYYGWREIVGNGYKYDDEYLKDIESVTAKDIKEVANKIFKQKSLTVIVDPNEK